MPSFVNSVATTFFISIILVSFHRIIIIRGQDDELVDINDAVSDGDDPSSNIDHDPSESMRSLFENLSGVGFPYAQFLKMTTGTRNFDDQYEFQLKPDMNDLIGHRVIIRQLGNLDQILSAQMSFHGNNGDLILDDDGNPVTYTSSRQHLGHVLDISHQGFPFSYAKCLLKLQPNSNFDLHSLFFHFAQPSKTPANNVARVINGSDSFSIDSPKQIYNVSSGCPFYATCMWLLDDAVISPSPDTPISITFDQRHVGNRTLAYVAYMGNKPRTLASLPLSILPSRTQVCYNPPGIIKNRWILAGDMSSPRVHFTATYHPVTDYVIIAGGTADHSTPLSSVDTYDPTTGCYNISSMIFPRMKHAASMRYTNDSVIVMGGMTQEENCTSTSELFSKAGAQMGPSMNQTRCLHEIADLGPNTILIVAGEGSYDSLKQLEIYKRKHNKFRLLEFSNAYLKHLHGHSVTALDDNEEVVVFGGFNGKKYFNKSFIIDKTNITTAEPSGEDIELIEKRAHHQATYIPYINSILITGGDNGTHTFSTSYLYNVTYRKYVSAGTMQVPRSFHSAVLLQNGSVLIIGGVIDINNSEQLVPLRSVEMYDPFQGSFTFVAPLNIARYQHKAVVSSSNVVFVFGGIGDNNTILSSSEYFDPYFSCFENFQFFDSSP